MRRLYLLPAAMAASFCALGAISVPGDAQRGLEVFKSQRCVTCHSVNGEGGRVAPDLGKRTGRSYSPSGMASLMWNHAPAMWSAMEKSGIQRPELSEDQAADLFAYFYAARYFEKPGDASRGRQVFVSKHCTECHNLTGANPEGGPPVVQWKSLGDPILLAEQMWDHSSPMSVLMARKKITRPALTGQDITDLLVYLQNLPQTKGVKPAFAPASAETGQMLFQVKGCADCHKGSNSLENRLPNRTFADLAAEMWNHAPKMRQPPPQLNGEEMRRIVGYLWSIQFFDSKGSSTAGKKVFTQKKCATCHNDASSGAPKLAGERSPYMMVAALWKHGPAMLDRMRQKRIDWPRFKDAEMADLLSYVKTRQ